MIKNITRLFLPALYLNNFIFFSFIFFITYNKDFLLWLAIMTISLVIIILISIFNFIYAFKLFKDDDLILLRKKLRISKFASIPYFVINFIFCALILFLLFAASHGFFIVFPINPGTIYLWWIGMVAFIATISTSSYGIFFLIKLRQKHLITTSALIIHSVLICIFIVDIIDTALLLKEHKKEKVELII